MLMPIFMNNIPRKIVRCFCFLLLHVTLASAQVSPGGLLDETSDSPIAMENNTANPSDVTSENANKVTIDFVTVGDPGNAPSKKTSRDERNLGSVAAPYQIGKYEVTAHQYCDFLNAVAAVDTFQLYDKRMSSDKKVEVISRIKTAVGYHYEVKNGRGDFPITYVSWLEAARFCNWMHNGQPVGPQGPTTTERGAYELNGATIFKINLEKQYCSANPDATYFIPTEDQWCKAAYYKGGSSNAGYWMYPTQSDDAPGHTIGDQPNQANYKESEGNEEKNPSLTPVNAFTGSCSYYGVFDMGGNVWEWTDAPCFEGGDYKVLTYYIHGGSWNSVKALDFLGLKSYGDDDLRRDHYIIEYCTSKENNIGFRVAAPTSQKEEDAVDLKK